MFVLKNSEVGSQWGEAACPVCLDFNARGKGPFLVLRTLNSAISLLSFPFAPFEF